MSDSVAKVAKVVKEKTAKVATAVSDKTDKTNKPKTRRSTKAKAVAEEQQETPQEQTEVVGGKKKVKRTFTVLSVKRDGKEEDYSGKKIASYTPGGAARKSATQACKTLYGSEPHCVVDISIRETTKNATPKEYSYRATRTLNTKDVDFKNNTGEKIKIPFKYSMTLKSLKKDAAGNVTEEQTVADTSTV